MKKVLFKNITLFVLYICLALPALAQTTPMGVKIVNEQIERVGNNATVNLEFIFDNVAVRSNDMVIYTPVIISVANSADRIALPPILFAGSKRNKMLNRQLRLNGQLNIEAQPIAILKKNNRKQQSITYSTTVAYSDWMQGATLLVENAVSGCADCYDQGNDLLVASNIMKSVPTIEFPVFVLTYIEPEVEEVKARADSHTATFNFVVGRYELIRDYKNNQTKFDEVDRIIREVMSNDDIEITEFNIAGYASPEGSAPQNKTLAERRADAFANYLVTKFNVSKNKFTVESFGEDWSGLKEAVETSSIADKADILNIIATIDNVDARDVPLKRLSNGDTYRTLLNDFYPPLRRTEYTIAYVVRSFDVEEAKEIIKTNPKLLSLNEMYMVAHSYGADTPQFKEVFDIAVRMYPDSEIAIMNSAAADIENNDFDRAINQMHKLDNNPKAWNNMGVAYALKGDLEKALKLFGDAAAASDADGISNLEKLKAYMEKL